MNIVKNLSKIVIILILTVIGFLLFTFFPVHFDFSKNSAYTLSPATKKTIQSIKKPLTIQVFLSSDLPTKLLPLKTDVLELLQEYKKSGKNILVTTRDPKNDTKAADKIKEYGIPQMQFSQLEQNKYQVSTAYFAVVLTYEDKTEIIPQVTDYPSLEYNLTAAIFRMTRSELPSIAIVGEQENLVQTNSDPLLLLKQALSQQYSITSVQLKTIQAEDKDSFNKKYASIIVVDPENQKYESEEIALLKSYFESGGKIIALSGGTSIDEQTLSASASQNNMNELTASYGATIKNNLVLSTAAEYVNFGNTQSQFLVAYPFWIRTNTFDEKSGLFANIQYFSFPWVSEIEVSIKNNIKVSPLILSSKRSWAQTEPFTLNPDTIAQPKATDLKERTLGILLENTKGGKMVVVGSSRFPYGQYIGQGSGNLDFILNTIDTFSSNGALVGIRSRSLSSYPIADMSDGQKNIYKYVAILSFPLLWGIYGGIRLLRRK